MWWWWIHCAHLAKDLQEQGHNVRVVDKKPLNQWYQPVEGTEKLVLDLELREHCMSTLEGMDMVYNLACNMGGMGFIENNHALCMPSVLINAHMLVVPSKNTELRTFFIVHLRVRIQHSNKLRLKVLDQALAEADAYAADPERIWMGKLFNEILTNFYEADYDMNVRIPRYHNVYGAYGTWQGGREKAPLHCVVKSLKQN